MEPIKREGLEIAGPGAMAGSGGGIGTLGNRSGQPRSDPANRLFFGGLPRELTEANLVELLSPFGAVRTASIVRGPEGVSKGYGFAEMVDVSLTQQVSSALSLNSCRA